MSATANWTAFVGENLLITGEPAAVARRVWEAGLDARVFVFDDVGGRPIDLDLRGDWPEVLAREVPGAAPEAAEEGGEAARPGRGRPRLGVVSREVSLLPRHWAWLEGEKGGASAALRRLAEEARRADAGRQEARVAWAAAGRFMTEMAGDRVGFEAASRALWAKDGAGVRAIAAGWPADVREHLARLVAIAEAAEGRVGDQGAMEQAPSS